MAIQPALRCAIRNDETNTGKNNIGKDSSTAEDKPAVNVKTQYSYLYQAPHTEIIGAAGQ